MLAQNLHYLRRKKGHSQQEVADLLEIPRTTWSGYELGKVEPNITMLQKISAFFHQPIDRLLSQRIDYDEIELVYSKASAGYLDGFQDPEYVRDLPKMYIPGLPSGTYRAFEIQGDSMLPMPSGSLVISRYIETLKEVKDDKTYVIITHRDGIVYKRVRNHSDRHCITAISDNEIYPPFTIDYSDIQEIWRYHAHIGFSDAKQQSSDWLQETVMNMQKKISEMERKM